MTPTLKGEIRIPGRAADFFIPTYRCSSSDQTAPDLREDPGGKGF